MRLSIKIRVVLYSYWLILGTFVQNKQRTQGYEKTDFERYSIFAFGATCTNVYYRYGIVINYNRCRYGYTT